MKCRCNVCGYIHEGETPPQKCSACGVGVEKFIIVPEIKWKCTVCGYIHYGDTPPDICPICKRGPEVFILLDDESEELMMQEVLYGVTYGLYVVTSVMGGKKNGMVCNTFMQVSINPLKAVLSMGKTTLTNEYILDSGVFAVSFLSLDNMEHIKRFGFQTGREIDKFDGLKFKLSEETRCPILPDSNGYVECRIERENIIDVGTHNIYLSKVVGGKTSKRVKEPLKYSDYQRFKNTL